MLRFKTLSLFVTHLCFSALWIQNQYEKHKEVSTAQGVKILGKDLEKTLAGLPLLVAHKEDEIPVLRVTVTLQTNQSCPSLSRRTLYFFFRAGWYGQKKSISVDINNYHYNLYSLHFKDRFLRKICRNQTINNLLYNFSIFCVWYCFKSRNRFVLSDNMNNIKKIVP